MQADELNWYRWLLAMVLTGLGLTFFFWLGFLGRIAPPRSIPPGRPKNSYETSPSPMKASPPSSSGAT